MSGIVSAFGRGARAIGSVGKEVGKGIVNDALDNIDPLGFAPRFGQEVVPNEDRRSADALPIGKPAQKKR